VRVLNDADVLAAAERTGWELVTLLPDSAVGHSPAGYLHRVWAGDVAGQRTLFIVIDPNAVADPALRQVLLMRHLAMFEGACPACAARRRLPNRATRRRLRRNGQVGRGTMEHEPECPVSDEAVREAAMARLN
jgi:hypothetical protein